MNAPLAAAAAAPLLVARRGDGVVRLTLNRPSQFNVLSQEMLAALHEALDRIAGDAGARVVVLAGAGKAFCAGHDFKEMKADPRLAHYQQLFECSSKLMLRIQSLPQPVIARVHGLATAAGCQLVAMCDLAVASTGARFAVSGVDYGLFCATPSVALTRNVGRKAAFEMLVTGEFIDAETARARGLVNRVTAPDDLDPVVEQLAGAIVAKPALAIRMGKQVFYRQQEMGIAAAYQLAGQVMAVNMADDVAQEGVAAFLEKRKPRW